MSMKYVILPIMLVFLFTSGLSLGQGVENNTSLINSTNTTSLADNTSLNESVAAPAASLENSTNASAPNLKYIWSINGIEDEQVIMALDQDGSDLFGQAKYEPESGDPWNGIVDGSIAGNQVNLVITAQKGNSLESIKLKGAFAEADEAISGKFTRISDGKIADKGDFNAMWINPDISSYTPATVTKAASQTMAAPAQTQTTNTTTPAVTTGQTTQQPVQLGSKSKYVDVHEYADKIGPGGDMSGVPPGMGCSGGL